MVLTRILETLTRFLGFARNPKHLIRLLNLALPDEA